MKKTRLIDLFTNIKLTKVSFLSITIFVALSISIYLGFTWVMDGINLTVDTYESDSHHNLHDLEIVFPYCFSDEDVEKVENLDDVTEAEGRRIIYDYFTIDSSRYQAKVIQITENIDKLELIKGRLPSACGEIAVDSGFAQKHSLNIGDSIRLESDKDDGSIPISKIMSFDPSKDDIEEFLSEDTSDKTEKNKYLNADTFTITALVISPEYACNAPLIYGFSPENSLNIDTVLFVDESSFDTDEFLGYTDMLISGKNSDYINYKGQNFDAYISDLKADVETLLDPMTLSKKDLVDEKENEILDAVNSRLDEAQQEIAGASMQIADNQMLIDQGQKEISEAEYQVGKGKTQLEEAKSQLDEAKTQLEEGKNKLASAKTLIANGKAELEEGKEEFSAKEQEWLEGYNKLEAAKEQLAKGTEEYEYNRCLYDGAMRDLNVVKSIFEQGKTVIADIRSKSVTPDNYQEYLSKWNLSENIDTLKRMKEKYGGQYDISFGSDELLNEIQADIETYCQDPDEEALNTLLGSLSDLYESTGNSIIEKFEDKLKEALDQLDHALEEIHAAQEQINHGQAQVDYGEMQLNDARDEISEKEQELADAEDRYNAGLKEYNDKNEQYLSGLKEFEEKRAELLGGEYKLSGKQNELNSGVSRLSDAREKLLRSINDFESQKILAKEQMDELSTLNLKDVYAILARSSVVYLNSVIILDNILGTLKYTLAGLFVIIGVLVCYSAVTRMVYLQTSIIGTKKALGFTEGEITRFYLCYIGMACLIGCVLGTVLGVIFERVLMSAYSSSLLFDRYYHVYHLTPLLLSWGLQFLVLILITFLASRKILSKEAVDLLAGTEESSGKHRFYEQMGFFKKLSFLGKTIVNNCFTEKRRVFGTIVGVMGSTALIVTALTFSFNVNLSIKKQFSDFYHFNHIISFDSSESEDAKDNILTVLKNHSVDSAVVRRMYVLNDQPNGMKGATFMYVPEDSSDLSRLVNFDIRNSKGALNPYEGIWMNYSFWNYFKNETDNELNLVSVSGDKATVPITGYFDHYLTYGEMFVSKDCYEKYLKKDFVPNAILVNIKDDDLDAILSELQGIDGYIKDENYYESGRYSFNVIKSFSTVVVILYLLLAVTMSVLVLLNLLNQFVDEKKRELIIMLINGFEYSDARRYIYADTIVLTFFGLIFGTVLGTVTGILTVKGFNSAMVCLIQKVSIPGIILGISGAALLTFGMTLTALKKIDRFELTDINRY